MRNLRKKGKRLTGTPAKAPIPPVLPADRALLELRALGRAVLTEPSSAPSFVIAPYGCEGLCVKAKIDGRIVEREPGETYENFERRIAGMFPAQGRPGFVVMLMDPPAQTIPSYRARGPAKSHGLMQVLRRSERLGAAITMRSTAGKW
jgi:hypothetical protein